MQKLIAVVLALGTAFFFVGCADDGYYSSYDDRPGYYSSGYNDDVDFYYESSRPYSRDYGPLYLRDGRYYYSSGGSYVVYDRPTRVYRNTNYRVVNRDVNVRNVRYNNERVVRNQRTTRDYDRSRTHLQHHSDYQQRNTQPTRVRLSNAQGHRNDVHVVGKEKKRKHNH